MAVRDADGDVGFASGLVKVVASAAQIVAGGEGGVNRALWMVLIRDRRAKQCEDAVAGGLHHVTVVAMDRVDHQRARDARRGVVH